MDRKAFLALREEVWVSLFRGKDLEVCLVPAEMPDLTTARLIGLTPQALARDLCTNAFVNFRGYVDGGEPVPNTIDNRLELYGFPNVRDAINGQLERLNVKALEGEGDAASD